MEMLVRGSLQVSTRASSVEESKVFTGTIPTLGDDVGVGKGREIEAQFFEVTGCSVGIVGHKVI